jgi:hypothetical protein
MPEYVLNRTYTHRSTHGHIVNFVKGQPVFVPPILEREVAQFGAEPVDGERVDLLSDMDEKKAPEAPTGADRRAILLAAFEQLEKRNQRGDFTGQGRPNLSILKDLVGFEVSTRERDETWEEMKNLATQ